MQLAVHELAVACFSAWEDNLVQRTLEADHPEILCGKSVVIKWKIFIHSFHKLCAHFPKSIFHLFAREKAFIIIGCTGSRMLRLYLNLSASPLPFAGSEQVHYVPCHALL